METERSPYPSRSATSAALLEGYFTYSENSRRPERIASRCHSVSAFYEKFDERKKLQLTPGQRLSYFLFLSGKTNQALSSVEDLREYSTGLPPGLEQHRAIANNYWVDCF
ncbi:hypothetical protein VN12_18975 [Pirellula sp. SH-Sr6A]|nr:hypothetical protein VN12_18975 [Pirellula sp. SH-Sr6A]